MSHQNETTIEEVTHELDRRLYSYECPNAQIAKQSLALWQALVEKHPNVKIPHIASHGENISFEWYGGYSVPMVEDDMYSDLNQYHRVNTRVYVLIDKVDNVYKAIARFDGNTRFVLPDQRDECIEAIMSSLSSAP